MPKEIKGHAHCPECNDTQAVQFDGRKYFISCTHCRTFTSYQSAEAKARIQARLIQPDKPEPVQGTPDTKTNGEPFQPVRNPSFLESLTQYL